MKNCKLLFVGDIVIKKDLNEFLSKKMEDIVKKHDIVSCNLEGPLPTSDAKPILKVGPNIYQHPNVSKILLKAGFNLINLANNHIFDYGQKALNKVLKSFSEVDLVGAGNSFNEAYKLKIIEKKGIRIGFFSFAEWGFGATTNKNNPGFAWINHPSINQRIKTAKKIVDILIIQVHAGAENVIFPLPEWKRKYRQFVDLGADVIIGHHPHTAQGWEIYKQKYIFYSLGNFYFEKNEKNEKNEKDPNWNRGYMVSISVNKNKLIDFDVIPIKREKNMVKLYQNPNFKKYLIKLRDSINDQKYIQNVNLQSLKLWEEIYKEHFESFSIGKRIKNLIKTILKIRKTSKELVILHFFKIETHRFTIERAMGILSKKIK